MRFFLVIIMAANACDHDSDSECPQTPISPLDGDLGPRRFVIPGPLQEDVEQDPETPGRLRDDLKERFELAGIINGLNKSGSRPRSNTKELYEAFRPEVEAIEKLPPQDWIVHEAPSPQFTSSSNSPKNDTEFPEFVLEGNSSTSSGSPPVSEHEHPRSPSPVGGFDHAGYDSDPLREEMSVVGIISDIAAMKISDARKFARGLASEPASCKAVTTSIINFIKRMSDNKSADSLKAKLMDLAYCVLLNKDEGSVAKSLTEYFQKDAKSLLAQLNAYILEKYDDAKGFQQAVDAHVRKSVQQLNKDVNALDRSAKKVQPLKKLLLDLEFKRVNPELWSE